MNKLTEPVIRSILTLDRTEISGLDVVIVQCWFRQLASEVLELRKELENHNCCDVGCPCCGM